MVLALVKAPYAGSPKVTHHSGLNRPLSLTPSAANRRHTARSAAITDTERRRPHGRGPCEMRQNQLQ